VHVSVTYDLVIYMTVGCWIVRVKCYRHDQAIRPELVYLRIRRYTRLKFIHAFRNNLSVWYFCINSLARQHVILNFHSYLHNQFTRLDNMILQRNKSFFWHILTITMPTIRLNQMYYRQWYKPSFPHSDFHCTIILQ